MRFLSYFGRRQNGFISVNILPDFSRLLRWLWTKIVWSSLEFLEIGHSVVPAFACGGAHPYWHFGGVFTRFAVHHVIICLRSVALDRTSVLSEILIHDPTIGVTPLRTIWLIHLDDLFLLGGTPFQISEQVIFVNCIAFVDVPGHRIRAADLGTHLFMRYLIQSLRCSLQKVNLQSIRSEE